MHCKEALTDVSDGPDFFSLFVLFLLLFPFFFLLLSSLLFWGKYSWQESSYRMTIKSMID